MKIWFSSSNAALRAANACGVRPEDYLEPAEPHPHPAGLKNQRPHNMENEE